MIYSVKRLGEVKVNYVRLDDFIIKSSRWFRPMVWRTDSSCVTHERFPRNSCCKGVITTRVPKESFMCHPDRSCVTCKRGERVNSAFYYTASSASGQEEPNRALWLATRAGKTEPSCALGTTRCSPQSNFHQKPYNKSFIDQVCSVKMAGYWPRSFFASYGPRFRLGP